jgi:hypothetical protein
MWTAYMAENKLGGEKHKKKYYFPLLLREGKLARRFMAGVRLLESARNDWAGFHVIPAPFWRGSRMQGKEVQGSSWIPTATK